ncbi:MAG: paraquat-inducible protein A [Pseudomonadota bacterium]
MEPTHSDQSDKPAASGLIACWSCDALLNEPPIGAGSRARCPRCDVVLTSDRAHSTDGVIASAVATIALLLAALALPFIDLRAGGAEKHATLIDAMRAAGGENWPLAFAVGAAIAAIPVVRALALLYVLAPLRLAGRAAPGAPGAFRLAIQLRPWSMVEVFIIGVVIALVKVSGLALLELGAAFWIFVCLAGVIFYEDASLCRRTVWRMLT